MTKQKALSEKETKRLEALIPARASRATRMAYQQAKLKNLTVVLAKNGFIVAEHADGSEVILEQSKPRRKVPTGVTLTLGAGSTMNARS